MEETVSLERFERERKAHLRLQVRFLKLLKVVKDITELCHADVITDDPFNFGDGYANRDGAGRGRV